MGEPAAASPERTGLLDRVGLPKAADDLVAIASSCRCPPRLDGAVVLAKAGRFRFTCTIDDKEENMEVVFEDELGRTLVLYLLPCYLEVMKFIEASRESFTPSDLPLEDPIGQI